MAQYRYKAIDSRGNAIDGELTRDSLSDAITELESKGLQIDSITLASNQDSTSAQPSPIPRVMLSGDRLKSHFDAVLARRDELVPAMEALTNELPRGATRRELIHLVELLRTARSGTELSRSRHATRWLPLLLTGLTQAAATERLGDLVSIAARESRQRSERRRVLAYPLAVLLITILVVALLCGIIVPPFRQMFAEFGLTLPAPTLLVISISDQITDHFVSTLISLVIAGVVAYIIARLWIRAGLTTRLLGRFVAGNSASVGAMASLVSQLTDLLSIGVALPDALWLAGEGCGHRFYQRAAEDLARHAHDSDQPLQQCPSAGVLPGNVIHALSAGPDGSPHLPLLHELGVMYSDNASHRTSWMTGAVAQISIVLIGLAVGFVVLALFAPMVSLISGLT